ncbi:hypothetical protein ACSN7O_004819, partial [Enterobacter chuandaensis]
AAALRGILMLLPYLASPCSHAGEGQVWGSVSMNMTISDVFQWTAETFSQGNIFLSHDGNIAATDVLAAFKITNKTKAAASWMITPHGSSVGSDGRFVASRTDDSTDTFAIRPVESNTELTFHADSGKYTSHGDLAASGYQVVSFLVSDSRVAVTPGIYRIELELFAPAV